MRFPCCSEHQIFHYKFRTYENNENVNIHLTISHSYNWYLLIASHLKANFILSKVLIGRSWYGRLEIIQPRGILNHRLYFRMSLSFVRSGCGCVSVRLRVKLNITSDYWSEMQVIYRSENDFFGVDCSCRQFDTFSGIAFHTQNYKKRL